MSSLLLPIALLVLISVVVHGASSSSSTTAHDNTKNKKKIHHNHNQHRSRDGNKDQSSASSTTCGLYLATSSTSTSTEPKWGIFAGEDIDEKSTVGYGDIAIHTFHLMANQLWEDPTTGHVYDDLDKNELANLVDWFEQYIWIPHSSGGQYELNSTAARIVTAIPGLGMIAGYNPKMTNCDWNHSSAYHREAWNEYPGVSHPGRGAYSNYFNVELYSTEVIPAGKEIFTNYGENWSEEKEDGEKTKEKERLKKTDYDKLDKTIEKIITFFDKYQNDLDSSTKQEIYKFLLNDVMTAAAGVKKGKQIANMLPTDPEELKEILANGGSFYLSSPTAIRTPKWLEENGLCIDHIKPGPSTIKYAGRGAFAKRPIKAGSLVAPVPLLQLPNKDVMNMYNVKVVEAPPVEEGDEPDIMSIRENNEKIGDQLLLNYCYGHPESTALFFPGGHVANYINHSKEKVNAKMVWSDHPNNNKNWFKVDPENLIDEGNHYIGLLMEIVATRDIEVSLSCSESNGKVLVNYCPLCPFSHCVFAVLCIFDRRVKRYF